MPYLYCLAFRTNPLDKYYFFVLAVHLRSKVNTETGLSPLVSLQAVWLLFLFLALGLAASKLLVLWFLSNCHLLSLCS